MAFVAPIIGAIGSALSSVGSGALSLLGSAGSAIGSGLSTVGSALGSGLSSVGSALGLGGGAGGGAASSLAGTSALLGSGAGVPAGASLLGGSSLGTMGGLTSGLGAAGSAASAAGGSGLLGAMGGSGAAAGGLGSALGSLGRYAGQQLIGQAASNMLGGGQRQRAYGYNPYYVSLAAQQTPPQSLLSQTASPGGYQDYQPTPGTLGQDVVSPPGGLTEGDYSIGGLSDVYNQDDELNKWYRPMPSQGIY